MIKLVVFDFDGVFTDGKFYFNNESKLYKSYNGKDSFSLNLLKEQNIKTGIITNDKEISIEYAPHIFNRLDKYSIGSNKPKIEILDEWLTEYNFSYDDVAYIGDDLPDIDILKNVRFSACPKDAVDNVKKICNYICKKNGGDGAVREFVEKVLEINKEKNQENKEENIKHIKKNGKITAVIPARSGSTRCKNKNIRNFCDTNLLKEKILKLKQIKEIDEIIVSSNCDEVLQIAKDNDVSFHKRDPYFTTSDCSGSEVFKNLAENITNEYTLYTHCVCPFTTKDEYKDAILKFKMLDNSKYDSVASFNKLKHFLWNDNGPINYSLDKATISQDLEELYIPNFSICIRKTEDIIKEKNVIGCNPLMIFSDAITGIDIDYNYEFIISELLKQNSICNVKDANNIIMRRDYTEDKIIMLDCTFRDGGYLNNWDFSYEDVLEGYKVVSESNYDYFEIGFRAEYDKIPNKGRWVYSTEEDIGIIKTKYPNGCKISVMTIVGQNDVNTFKPKYESNVDLIRILIMRAKTKSLNDSLFFDETSILNARRDADILLKKGYEITINVGCGDIISDNEINLIAKHFSDISSSLKALYIADTYGGFTSKNIPIVINKFQNAFDNYKPNNYIKFGFHIHNNRDDGLVKYKTAKFYGVSMCDTSINGLGRGAGNFKMEDYMLENLNKYSIEQFSNVLKLGNKFAIIKNELNYKKNMFYKIAGKLSLHPDYILEILEMNMDIDKGIELIMKLNKYTIENNCRNYDNKLIERLKK